MSEQNLPEKASMNINEIPLAVKEILSIKNEEWPNDKEISITVEFMVVPAKMCVNIRKKQ